MSAESESFRTIQDYIPSIDYDLERDAGMIDELLCDFYDNNPGSMLIDEPVEYDNPRIQFQYLAALTEVLGGRGEEHFTAAYTAYHFAISVARLLDWQVPAPGAAMIDFRYLQGSTNDEAQERLAEQTVAYLDDRPELASLISEYATDYARDIDAQFAEAAQIVCALTFERIEEFNVLRRLRPDNYVN